jgi:NAD-dependent dihydropyrimidine dehydrogenase PreA subunit
LRRLPTNREVSVSYTQEDVLEATRHLTGKTIPVHVRIEATQVSLAQPEMHDLLAAAETIAVGRCACREDQGNCDAPLDVCLSLDAEAREKMTERSWQAISLRDALELLETTFRHGLVHIAYRRGGGGIRFVCSCCTCCCWPLNGLRQFDYHDAIAESAYVAQYDCDACVGCGTCVERCPFGGFTLSANAARVKFTQDRCFGCGLCVETCPSGAIRLEPRADASRT